MTKAGRNQRAISEKTGVDKADVTVAGELYVIKQNMASGENILHPWLEVLLIRSAKKKLRVTFPRNTALVIDEHFVSSFKPAKDFRKQDQEQR